MQYVKNSIPVEKLLEYVNCENIIGNTIAQLIIDTLTKAGLDSLMHRSQTFDKAGNMTGKQKGVSNQFKEITGNQKSIYSAFKITAGQPSVTDHLRVLTSKKPKISGHLIYSQVQLFKVLLKIHLSVSDF